MPVVFKLYREKAQRSAFLCLFFFSALALAPGFAWAQQNVQDRVDRLENEIQTLSRAVFKGETPPPGSLGGGGDSEGLMAAMQTRVSQIESDMGSLTGRLEQQEYNQRQLQEKLDAVMARLADLEARAAGGVPPPSASAVPLMNTNTEAPAAPQAFSLTSPAATSSAVMPPQSAPGESPPVAGQLGAITQSPEGAPVAGGDAATAAYESSFALLRVRRYDEAEKGFAAFLAQNPSHSLTPNALDWMGETFYVRNNFERAARVFAESYQKYPKGPKAPDSLLKLALSLAGMGKKDQACVTLGQLKHEYPAGSAPVLERAEMEKSTLGCSF